MTTTTTTLTTAATHVTIITHDEKLCTAITKKGTFCMNKKTVNSVFCGLHSRPVVATPTPVAATPSTSSSCGVNCVSDSPKMCQSVTLKGDPCKNRVKTGNRKYCQVHGTGK
jgi:hypothetical protein